MDILNKSILDTKTIKVGDKYVTRDGKVVTILSRHIVFGNEKIKGDLDGNEILYNSDGRHMYPIEHDLDLISPVVSMNPRQVVEGS